MDDGITLRLVLERMIAMEQRLSRRFEEAETRLGVLEQRLVSMSSFLSREINTVHQQLNEMDIESLTKHIQSLENSQHSKTLNP